MKISDFSFQLLLCLSIVTPVAMAQGTPASGKEHSQGMSYEEYSTFREKMRMRMEKSHAQESNSSLEAGDSPAEQHAERVKPDSAYGQGYQSRNRSEGRPEHNRPDNHTNNRPERIKVEKPDRGDRMRR